MPPSRFHSSLNLSMAALTARSCWRSCTSRVRFPAIFEKGMATDARIITITTVAKSSSRVKPEFVTCP